MRLRNQLVELLGIFPEADWDEKLLIENVNLSESYLKHRRKDNSIIPIMNSPNLTWKSIKTCLDVRGRVNWEKCFLPGDIDATNIHEILKYLMNKDTYSLLLGREILSDPLLTIRDIDMFTYQSDPQHFAKIKSLFLSVNPNVTVQDLMKCDKKMLDLRKLSHNKNLTWDFISLHNGWDFNLLSKNPSITWEIIKTTTGWNLTLFAKYNPNMNLSVVHESLTSGPHHLVKEYAWVSYYPGITPEILEMYPNVKWDYNYLTGNKLIPFSYIRAHPEKLWGDVIHKSLFPWTISDSADRVTYEDVVENPWLHWVYNCLPAYEYIFTDERIYEFLEGKCSIVNESRNAYFALSENPNLTASMIKKYSMKPWSFHRLSKNKFNKEPSATSRLRTEGWNYGKNADHFDESVLREVMTLMLCNERISEAHLPQEIINMIADYMIYA